MLGQARYCIDMDIVKMILFLFRNVCHAISGLIVSWLFGLVMYLLGTQVEFESLHCFVKLYVLTCFLNFFYSCARRRCHQSAQGVRFVVIFV